MSGLEWLVTYMVHSTLAFAAIALVHRRTAPGIAEALWRAALLLPVGSATAASVVAAAWTIQPPLPPSPASLRWSDGADPSAVVLAVWMIGGGLLVVRDLLARRRFMTRIADRPAVTGPLADLLHELTRDTHAAGTRLTCSAHLASPIALGRREIVIPVRAHGLPPQQAAAMLAHELCHLLRNDSRWLQTAALLESLFFLQPLNRCIRRELQLRSEFAADRWAAAQVGDRAIVADCLLEVASWSRPSERPTPAPSMTRPGMLGRRVRALLADGGLDQPQRLVVAPILLMCVCVVASPAVSLTRNAPSAAYMEGYELGRRFRAAGGHALDPAAARELGRQHGRTGARRSNNAQRE